MESDRIVFIHTLQAGLYLLTDILEDVDDEEGCDKIVNALDITAGRMPDGPDEQNPLKDLKNKETQIKTVACGYNCTIHVYTV